MKKKVIVGRNWILKANQIIDCNVQIVKIQIEYTNQFKTTNHMNSKRSEM